MILRTAVVSVCGTVEVFVNACVTTIDIIVVVLRCREIRDGVSLLDTCDG
mgnify:CR=1 FL=1